MQVHEKYKRSELAHMSFYCTVNIALSEREHLVNGFKRDRSTPSKERRAKEVSIE